MPAEVIVSELMELLQRLLRESTGAELSELELKAVEFGRKAAQLALVCMLESRMDEPVVIRCECGGVTRAKDRRNRTQVTLAGIHSISRTRYRCEDCGEWSYL